MGCFEAVKYAVGKWSTVCVKGNHYSVPDRLVGQRVIVKLYSDWLVMVKDRQKVAVHERLSNQGNWALQLEHYLTTLLRKSGVLAGSVALLQVPHLVRQLFDTHFSRKHREFLKLLQYAREHGCLFRDITVAATPSAARDLIPGQSSQIEQLASDATNDTDSLFELNRNHISVKTAI